VVYSINGGTSSFSQTQGGWASMATKGYSLEFGGGMINNQVGLGGVLRHPVGNSVYSVGDTVQTFYLPTDLFANGRSVFMTGIGQDMTTKDGKQDYHWYAGGVSSFFQSQFFTGAQPEQLAGIASFNATAGKSNNLKVTEQLLMSSHSTLLMGMQWNSPKNNSRWITTLSFSGGLASMRQPYGAVSAILKRRTFDLRAEYVTYKKTIPLLDLPVLQYGEPLKENVAAEYRPYRFLEFRASRRNLLSFPSAMVSAGQSGNINTTDMATTTLQFVKTSLSGTYYDSRYMGQKSRGESFAAGRSITRYAQLGANYSVSHNSVTSAQKLATVYVTERITPQWNLTETYVHTNFNSYMAVGGSYFSNRFSAAVHYNTTYVPTNIQRPYQPNYSFDGTLKITSRLGIGASKSIDQYGKGYYGVTASFRSYHSDWAGNSAPIHIGDFAVRGQVMTSDGEPVTGLAVQIDKAVVYTDMDGAFELREHKKRAHRIQIDSSLSATMQNYEVVSGPKSVESVDDAAPGITIVVKPIYGRNAEQLYEEHRQNQSRMPSRSPQPSASPTPTATAPSTAAPATAPAASSSPAPSSTVTPTASAPSSPSSTPTAMY
jgi:hypothetical protein